MVHTVYKNSNHRRPFHGFKSILGYSIDKGYTPNSTKGVIQKSKKQKAKIPNRNLSAIKLHLRFDIVT